MCMNISAELSGNASAEKAQLQFERKMAMVPSVLEPVFARKSGVPMHCVTSRVVFYSGMAAQDGGEDVVTRDEVSAQRGVDTSTQQVHLPSGDLEQPLVPGLYNLVPRAWLRDWRSYVKDVEAPRLLSHLNCAALVCQAHRQLVVPPHLEEYLLGLRASLLGALGLYPGEVVEVLSAEEWDALQDVFRDAGDFSARFCLDGSGAVYWSTGVCTMCDPLSYTPLLGRSEKKKNSARSVNREDGTALDMLY